MNMPSKKTTEPGSSKTENLEVKPAFFLDRDGVINVDHGYVYQKDKLRFLGNMGPCLQKLASNFHLIVVTNQSGIARKYFSLSDVNQFHDYLNQELEKKFATKIDAFYVCPHHPDFSGKCECRKPEVGMLQQASEDFAIDLENSYMIGDKKSDILCANSFGLKSIQLLGKYERSEEADYHCNDWNELEELLRTMKLIQ